MLTGCIEDEPFITRYSPIYSSRKALQENIKLGPPVEIEKAGKIYLKDNFVFIVDEEKGIHIIDNGNPDEPVQLGFLQVFGCSDLAIRQDVIYVNNAVDLVALRIEGTSVKELYRIPDTFTERLLPPDGGQMPDYFSPNDSLIIVGWESLN